MKDRSEFKLPNHFGHIILWGSVIFVVIMLVWAYFAVLDEATTAQGQVIPSRKTQLVQNLEGGIVRQILVKEGQVVDKGQVLIRMDDVKFSSNYREGTFQEAAFKIKAARLSAELKHKPFMVAKDLSAAFPELVASEQDLYNSRKQELQNLRSQRRLVAKEINMARPLIKEGAVSEVEVLRLQQRFNEINRDVNRFRSVALQELNSAKTEAARLHENNVALKDRLERTALRSPVKGIIEQVYVTTVGEVTKPGMSLIEIVPLDDTLRIEARVRPQDIGFLHVGQEAAVKISAYDFSIYGNIPGKVEHISADTNTDADGNSFYEVWVRTKQNYLQSRNGRKLRIIPGMHASVDILTGKKSVMDYLLKPLIKTKYNALRER